MRVWFVHVHMHFMHSNFCRFFYELWFQCSYILILHISETNTKWTDDVTFHLILMTFTTICTHFRCVNMLLKLVNAFKLFSHFWREIVSFLFFFSTKCNVRVRIWERPGCVMKKCLITHRHLSLSIVYIQIDHCCECFFIFVFIFVCCCCCLSKRTHTFIKKFSWRRNKKKISITLDLDSCDWKLLQFNIKMPCIKFTESVRMIPIESQFNVYR